MTHKISILIALYNAEKYIIQCIDSIVRCKLFEICKIIILDDGSQDNSFDVVNSYLNEKFVNYKNSIFLLKNDHNLGISLTRQKLLESVDTDYFIFVDADDWVEDNFIVELFETAENSNSDIVICSHYREESTTKKIISKINNKNNYISSLLTGNIAFSLCIKFFKSSFVKNNNINFFAGIDYAEDFLFSIKAFLCTDKINIVDKCLYHLRRFENESFTSNMNIKKFTNYFQSRFEALKLLQGYSNYKEIKGDCLKDFISNKVKFLKTFNVPFSFGKKIFSKSEKQFIKKNTSSFRKINLIFMLSYSSRIFFLLRKIFNFKYSKKFLQRKDRTINFTEIFGIISDVNILLDS